MIAMSAGIRVVATIGFLVVVGCGGGTGPTPPSPPPPGPPPITSVSVTLAAGSIQLGQTSQATAELKDATGNVLSGRSVSWSTDNQAVATVSSSGLVTGVGAGSANVVATSEGRTGSAAIQVLQVPVASVLVTLTSTTIEKGLTTQASAAAMDANGNVLQGRPVTWSTGSGAIATVSTTGLVTAVGPGETYVRATSGTVTGQTDLIVTVPTVATVTVSPSTATLQVGKTRALTVSLQSAAGEALTDRAIAWTSSAPSVTISADGVVTAVAVGSATITATSEGKTGTATITVEPVSFGNGTWAVGTDIPPGTYRSINIPSASCYWERLSGFGGTSAEIIANDIDGGVRLVTIAASDVGFRSNRCGTWAAVSGSIRPDPSANFDVGVFMVGTEVAPGLWRSASTTRSCYWERLTGFGGTSADRITNDIGDGPRIVAIATTDQGFSSSGCAPWSRVTGPSRSNPDADFGEGMFMVGGEVSPGTWRSNGTGTGCYWERLRGFSGESADRITNDFGDAPAIVTIAPTDVGFVSSRCGDWVKQ